MRRGERNERFKSGDDTVNFVTIELLIQRHFCENIIKDEEDKELRQTGWTGNSHYLRQDMKQEQISL